MLNNIRKKTHKFDVLKFWIEGVVILLYGFWFSFYSCLIVFLLPIFLSCNVEEGLSLEKKIGRNRSAGLSHILSRNEKVEQHIEKKTHKANALRF